MNLNPSIYRRISIVLPCYNPPAGWDQIVIEEVKYIGHLFPDQDIEVIIVNDGSDTDEQQAFQRCQSVLPHCILIDYEVNKGKGHAVREGVAKATGDIIIYTDIDFPYDRLSTIKIITTLIKDDLDVALGQRDQSYYKSIPMQRRLISKFLQSIIKRSLSLKTSDTQGGLKGFTQQGKIIFLQTTIDRYLFDLEFIKMLSLKSEIKIGLVVISAKEDIKMKHMGLSQLWQSAQDFLSLLR